MKRLTWTVLNVLWRWSWCKDKKETCKSGLCVHDIGWNVPTVGLIGDVLWGCKFNFRMKGPVCAHFFDVLCRAQGSNENI